MRPPLWLFSGVLGVLVGIGGTVVVTELGADQDVISATPTPTTLALPRAPILAERPSTTTTTVPEFGSRARPLPLGEGALLQDREAEPLWDIEVLSYTENATASVMTENSAQDLPIEGEQYAIVRVRATYLGATEPARLGDRVAFQAVDASNVAYDYNDACLIYPDELDSYNDVFTGGTIEGNLCWSVSSKTASSLLLALGSPSGSTGPPYFMAVN